MYSHQIHPIVCLSSRLFVSSSARRAFRIEKGRVLTEGGACSTGRRSKPLLFASPAGMRQAFCWLHSCVCARSQVKRESPDSLGERRRKRGVAEDLALLSTLTPPRRRPRLMRYRGRAAQGRSVLALNAAEWHLQSIATKSKPTTTKSALACCIRFCLPDGLRLGGAFGMVRCMYISSLKRIRALSPHSRAKRDCGFWVLVVALCCPSHLVHSKSLDIASRAPALPCLRIPRSLKCASACPGRNASVGITTTRIRK